MRLRAAVAAALLVAFALLGLAGSAEARTRSFCGGLVTRSCGGHLQPACSNGDACDAGHTSYSGSPFPITIECPSIIRDVTVTSGCYDSRPNCGDCSANGQIPCPAEAEPWCTAGCDAGLAPHSITGLCRAPRVAGDSCGPAEPCAAGFTCDPLEGFRCVANAGADESCADPFVKCAEGLQCTLALRCSHEPARLDETCDVTAPCGPDLFCQAGIPQRCQPVRELGEACGPAAHCRDGLLCDPLAGFTCVEPAGPDEPCLLRGCRQDLVCTAKGRCSHRPALVGESCDIVNWCARGSFCRRDTGGILGALLGTCAAYKKPGETCSRDLENGTSDCVPGTSCELFLAGDGTGFQCVVEGTGEPIPDPVCRSFYSPAQRSEAMGIGLARTFGAGAESSAGVGTTYEAGAAYGPDGRYGCYFSTCQGVSIDVGYEAFAATGFYNGFEDVAGYSINFFEEAQILGVVNFATSQIFARGGPDDLSPGAFIGTADALALGTPTNPSPVAAGALLCTSSLAEVELITNDYGVIEPRAVPEPAGGLLAGGALLALRGLLAWRRVRRATSGAPALARSRSSSIRSSATTCRPAMRVRAPSPASTWAICSFPSATTSTSSLARHPWGSSSRSRPVRPQRSPRGRPSPSWRCAGASSSRVAHERAPRDRRHSRARAIPASARAPGWARPSRLPSPSPPRTRGPARRRRSAPRGPATRARRGTAPRRWRPRAHPLRR